MEEKKYKIFDYAIISPEDIKYVVEIDEPWDDAKDEKVLEFKEEITKQLENNLYCPYCRCRLDNYRYAKSIDHIVYKQDYPAFTYQPRNLVLACRRCNTIKKAENVLINQVQEEVKSYQYYQYPFDSQYYKIVHPFLDSFLQHIEIWENTFFLPKTGSDKGRNTIEMLKLDRFELLERRSKGIMEIGPKLLKNAISSSDLDEAVSIWYGILLMEDDFKENLFKILNEFEAYCRNPLNKTMFVLSESSYNEIKNAIHNNIRITNIEFQYYLSSKSNFIKRINRFEDSDVDAAIEQLESLYKLRTYSSLFKYSLVLALIFTIKKENQIYNKKHLERYIILHKES